MSVESCSADKSRIVAARTATVIGSRVKATLCAVREDGAENSHIRQLLLPLRLGAIGRDQLAGGPTDVFSRKYARQLGKLLKQTVVVENKAGAEPDRYRYSSSGPGSINHLGIELFKLKAGNLSAQHIPYKGNNPALMAVISGEVDFALDTFGTSIGHQQAGKLRYLAVCSEKRSQLAPDLPTTAEAGLPDVLVSTVNPIALPVTTPPEVVAVITNATRQILSDDGFLAELRSMSIEPANDADPGRSAEFFTSEMQRWAPIVKASGATIE